MVRPAGHSSPNVTSLPAPAVHYLVEGTAVGPDLRSQRPVRRMAQPDEEGHVTIDGNAQDLAGLVLIAHRRVTRADAEVRRGDHDRVGGLTEVVVADEAGAVIAELRRDQRDRGRGAGDVARAPPDRGQRL